MKNVLLVLILFLSFATSALAQPLKGALSSSILKETPKTPEKPLDISDFRFSPAKNNSGSIFDYPRNKPAIALLSSAIIPGSGQAANGKWGRAALYFFADVAGIIYYIDRENTARDQESAYESFANQNWSVMAYAEWLVEYSEANGLNNGYEDLKNEIAGKGGPDFANTTNDWNKVSLSILHDVEYDTPFIFYDKVGSNFSHLLPDYGSQQYYELMSKYYQFQAGWQDFYETETLQCSPEANPDCYKYAWNGSEITDLFVEGRNRAEKFNDNYRLAGNILKLLVVNHVISAFDAYFVVKLKNSRLEPQANLLRPDSFSLILHF